jgi:hypothetical protein
LNWKKIVVTKTKGFKIGRTGLKLALKEPLKFSSVKIQIAGSLKWKNHTTLVQT